MKVAIAAAILFCAGLIGIGIYFAVRDTSGGPRIIPVDAAYDKRVQQGSWVRGNEGASVTVTEYADIQCPACMAFNPIINGAFEQTKNIAKFEFKHYPLTTIHDNARKGAIAAEAAGRQGKFWEMTDLLYARQSDWETVSDSQFNAKLADYAGTLSLNVDQFKKDLKDSSILEQIQKDVAEGDKIPVRGTPTIVINGKALSSTPQTVEDLVTLINQAAADASQS